MASKKTQGLGARAAKKSSAKSTTTTAKSAGTNSATKKSAATKSAAKASATKKTATKKTATKKTAAKKTVKASTKKTAAPSPTAAGRSSTSRKAAALRVRSDESPWTPEELDAVRAELLDQQERLRGELAGIEEDIQQLMRDSGDGSGDDEVDTGAKTSGREQEFTVARNSQAMLDQGDKALHAIDDGSYGVCENCGKPIGKLRMQAQPRATLCVACKQLQERH